jgi:hypothetical protein
MAQQILPHHFLHIILREKNLVLLLFLQIKEENQKHTNINFWEMFDAYCKKLNFVPIVIFISFFMVGKIGQMISEVEIRFPQYMKNIKQFRFNRCEPNLSKSDSILMSLSK